jgi:dipeptidyl aminopeptidase/acylaminoacyl peptidase
MKKLLLLLLWTGPLALAQENITYQRPPAELATLLEAPLTPAVIISPDKKWMVLLDRSDYPTVEELSRPEVRLAGLRMDPNNFGQSRQRYLTGIKFKNLADKKEYIVKGLPTNLLISSPAFSPDGYKMAFLHNQADRIELWMVDMTSLTASKMSDRRINAVFGNPFSWLADSNHILFTSVPDGKGPLGDKSRIPTGPTVEENLGKKAPNRTYQDLLKNSHDEKAFDFYATAQLVLKNIRGNETLLGTPAIYTSISPSPDGTFILTKTLHRPYSYIVPFNRFPQTVTVIDTKGNTVRTIVDTPLLDNLPNGFNAVQTGPRAHAWRNDMPSTLYWVEAQDGGDPKTKADIRDKVVEQKAPFSEAATELIKLPLRFTGVTWGNATTAWVYEFWWVDRKVRTYQLNPSTRSAKIIEDRSSEDVYKDPGNVLTEWNTFGRSVMMMRGNEVWMTGVGSSPQGDLPFLDKLDISTGKKTRLWQCAAPYFETVSAVLDPKKSVFITSRESLTENPNYFMRSVSSKAVTQLTAFPHPYPSLQNVKKQVLKYKRDDGVELTADLYVPADYKKENGPLPTFLWAYPEEFKSSANAGQVKGSPYTFPRLGWGSAVYWVARGYAILDNASIPIVGEGDKEPNDSYVKQLVASAKAAIDYGASIGVVDPNRVAAGGHSYGAFMTANLLAHSDLFKAGIARSGAYNRTLTPFGFQSEERTYWEAPQVYFDMSPFSFADKIKEPILLIHGEADNNSGTFPLQSERFYNALKGHGATTRFVLLPYESHGYQAKENLLHILWEMDRWLDVYVKNAGNGKSTSSGGH